MFKSICREFNVSESWLRTGDGSMEQDIPFEDEYMRAAKEIGANKDTATMQALISYWKMEPETKKIFWDEFLKIAEIYKSSSSFQNEQVQADATLIPKETTIEEAEAAYIKSRSKNAQKTASPVSNITGGAENTKNEAV